MNKQELSSWIKTVCGSLKLIYMMGTVKRLLHTEENNTINIFILQRLFLNSFFYHIL